MLIRWFCKIVERTCVRTIYNDITDLMDSDIYGADQTLVCESFHSDYEDDFLRAMGFMRTLDVTGFEANGFPFFLSSQVHLAGQVLRTCAMASTKYIR